MKKTFAAAALLGCMALAANAQDKSPKLEYRWLYLASNFYVDKNVDEAISLLERAAKAGYNGVAITDSKFMRWDSLDKRYAANVGKVADACRRLKIGIYPCVMPMGYSEGLLGRDPNLAAALPVKDAPFIVRGGRLVPDDETPPLANGGFEQYKGDKPAGWEWADESGKISFIDTEVKAEGAASLRMQDIDRYDPKNGHGRVMQTLKVRPFRYYHISLMIKTQDFQAADEIRIAVLTKGGASLNQYDPAVAHTQDFKRVDVTFNSQANEEVRLYLGVWGGKGGKIWWDDVKIGPGGLVNVVRRDGAPLSVRDKDGATTYEEGRDFTGASDPKLGVVPWAGGFSVWHEQPKVVVPAGSRLHDGQRVLVSYYHTAIIHNDQVACDMLEPKVYDICRWQVDRVRDALKPDGYFMEHDEIRVQGWEPAFEKLKLTPGAALADNVRKCAEIIHKADAGKPVFVWSDMFDPFHNAGKTGSYYLVKGDGPWYESWKGLDEDVIVVNWHGHTPNRVESLKHFASLGNKQILAGYYDGEPKSIRPWLDDAAQAGGCVGVMYTTWKHNYADLETFLTAAREEAARLETKAPPG